jgi:hypothetical protein
MQNNLLKNLVRDFAKSSATVSTIALVGSILGLGLVGVNPAGAVTFGTNLIINGDAEANIGTPVSGWTNSVGTVTAIPYGTPGFPSTTTSGPVNRGNNFFSGGTSSISVVNYSIDVSANFGVIDTGSTRYTLSAFLGGTTFGNVTRFRILFDRPDPSLLNPFVRYDTPAAPFNFPGLFEQSTSGSVPIGTRSIIAQLEMIGPNLANDTYADNLSLVLTDINATATSVPEPSAVPGILIGGALVVGAMKKRRKNL